MVTSAHLDKGQASLRSAAGFRKICPERAAHGQTTEGDPDHLLIGGGPLPLGALRPRSGIASRTGAAPRAGLPPRVVPDHPHLGDRKPFPSSEGLPPPSSFSISPGQRKMTVM